jgi:hypothetical protein
MHTFTRNHHTHLLNPNGKSNIAYIAVLRKRVICYLHGCATWVHNDTHTFDPFSIEHVSSRHFKWLLHGCVKWERDDTLISIMIVFFLAQKKLHWYRTLRTKTEAVHFGSGIWTWVFLSRKKKTVIREIRVLMRVTWAHNDTHVCHVSTWWYSHGWSQGKSHSLCVYDSFL